MKHGCDISAYQNGNPPQPIDFQKMKDSGAEFVIMRKHLGYYQDLQFEQNAEGADKAGLAVGAYGVLYPGYDTERQIEAFCQGISPSDLVFPPYGDIERRHSLSKSRAISDVLAYMYGLKNWWGDADFYTAKYVWQDYYSSKAGWIDDWGPLWVAHYNGQVQPEYIPIGWEQRKDGTLVPVDESWAIHQYSADGNGKGHLYGVSSRDVDLNWMQDWYWSLFINPGPPVEPPVAPVITLHVPKGTVVRIIEE